MSTYFRRHFLSLEKSSSGLVVFKYICTPYILWMSWEPLASARKKKLSVILAVTPAPVRVPSQMPFSPIFASVTSVANDKGNNEILLLLLLLLLRTMKENKCS